jgi:hypothetical protein
MELASSVELLASPVELKDADLDAVSAGASDNDVVDVKNNNIGVNAAVLGFAGQIQKQ